MFCRSCAHVAARFTAFVIVLLVSGQRFAFAQADDPASSPPPKSPPPVAPEQPEGLMAEPGFLSSAISLANQFGEQEKTPKSGFYPELSNMITGSGWVSVGPGYRQYFAGDRMMFETSAAVSWRMYKMAQVRLERQQLADGHLLIGAQAMWQDNTQVNYFGIGPEVQEDNRSQYRMQSSDIVGYATATTTDWLTMTGKFGWLGHPKLMDPGGTFLQDFPSTLDAFPHDPAAGLSEQPAFLHSEASITADTRDHRGHPTRGSLYRGALTNYWDKTYDVFTFHTWEAEAVQYVPLSDRRVVLAFHGWTVASAPDADHEIPFYLLPAIGGTRTLRDYHDFQFHDHNLLLLSAESRFAVFTHLDAALFGDVGNVARHFSDLNLDKTSYGAGVRLHNETTTLGRLDVAHGPQGWHLIVSTSEPMRLPRVRHTTAIIPFAP